MNEYPPDLIPGRTYRLTLNDCCIQGRIIATFIKYDGDEEYPDAHFDIGTLTTFWGVEFEEIADPTAPKITTYSVGEIGMLSTMMLHCGCAVSRQGDFLHRASLCIAHREKFWNENLSTSDIADIIYGYTEEDREYVDEYWKNEEETYG